jgi:hypothetical protein
VALCVCGRKLIQRAVHARTCFQDRDHINIAFIFAHKDQHVVYIILAGAIRFVLFLWRGGPFLFAPAAFSSSSAPALLSDARSQQRQINLGVCGKQKRVKVAQRASRLVLNKVQRRAAAN